MLAGITGRPLECDLHKNKTWRMMCHTSQMVRPDYLMEVLAPGQPKPVITAARSRRCRPHNSSTDNAYYTPPIFMYEAGLSAHWCLRN